MLKELVVLYSLLAFLILIRLFFFYSSPIGLKDGQQLNFKTDVYSDPKLKGNYQYLKTQYGNFWHAVPITIKTSSKYDLNFGDEIKISGRVNKIELNGTEQIQLISANLEEDSGKLSVLGKIRNHIIDVTIKSFTRSDSNIVLGIMLGIKNGLSNRQILAMQATGFSHFMVIDGMKITLFASFILLTLSYFLKRQMAIILSILIVLMYVALSGFEVSALRAGFMVLFALSAQMLGRQNNGVHALFLTAAILLLWDPLLITSVGFQLSFAATLGIITLKPLIKLKGAFMEDISMTLAAQATTLPILLTSFGSYGLLSVPAHALVLWEVPFIMMINGLGALVSFIVEPLGSLIMQLSTPLVWYFQNVNYFFGNLNFNLQITNFSVYFSIGYYLLLVSIYIILRNRQRANP